MSQPSTTGTLVRHRCHLAVAVALVLVGLAAACGVPSDGDARRLSPDQVPYQLTGTTVASTTTMPALVPPGSGTAVLLYYVTETGLRAVPVTVEEGISEVAVLELLAAGPAEGSSNRSVVQPGEVVSVLQDPENDGRLIVDLDAAIVQLPASEQLLAIGQIVLTLTDRPGVRSVVFTADNEPLALPRADGSIIDGPARRVDMIELIG